MLTKHKYFSSFFFLILLRNVILGRSTSPSWIRRMNKIIKKKFIPIVIFVITTTRIS